MPLRKGSAVRLGALAAATAAIAVPSSAQAASLSQNLTCTAQTVSSPLAIFGDLASYWLAPGGDFETGAAGWSLSNASVVAGNETFKVVPGTKSLKIGGGGLSNLGQATSPEFCVDPTHPTFRFLVKSSAPTALLNTYVNFKSATGVQLTVPAKLNTFTFGAWTLAASQPLATTIPSVFLGTGTTASLTFKLTTSTLGSSVNIDDVLVDPYRRG